MISRVAEHCFWLSRYLERAENAARILDVNQTLLLDFYVPLEQQWRPLLIISGIHDYKGEMDAETVQAFMTWDADNPCSIVRSMTAARENARIIREVISAEMWERINYYHLWLQGPVALSLYERSRSDFYSQIRRINQLIHGISDGTMSHGEPWDFFKLGTYLERACQTARILDAKYHILLPTPDQIGTPVDSAHWLAILTSCSGYEPYQKKQQRVLAEPSIAVAEFLIFDEQFPRSAVHCLQECQKATRAISGQPPDEPGDEVVRAIEALLSWLRSRDIHAVVREGLHETLTHVVNSIHEIGASIDKTYFDVRLQPMLSAEASVAAGI